MANKPTAPPGTIVQQTTQLIVPNIPKATDLNSALLAIQALTQAVFAMANAIPASAGSAAQAKQNTVGQTPSAFQVQKQITSTIRVTDPNDSTVFVDVTQITGLILYNPTTKETWSWSQSSPNTG